MADDKFTIKKEISVSHVLTFLCVLGSAAIFLSGWEGRMATAETRIQYIESNLSSVDNRLIRMDDKLDKLLEKLK